MSAPIYLDYNSSAPPSEATIVAISRAHREAWATFGAPHHLGQRFLPDAAGAYQTLYDFLGAHKEDTVLLTSSGAEAVNHVLTGCYLDYTREAGRNHFLTSAIDEAPVIMGHGRLEQLGCRVTSIPVGASGCLSADAVKRHLSPRSALLSLSWASGLTGVVQPIAEIAAVCQEAGVLLHVDATQVAGRLVLDLQSLPVDFVTLAAEPLYGPRGAGLLWIRRGISLSPFMLGGSDQGGGRAGSLPLPSLLGMAQAAQEALCHLDEMSLEGARLKALFERELVKRLPEAKVLFHAQERLSQTSCVAFPGVAAEALLYRLNKQGVYASMGGGNFQQIGLLLEACDLEPTLALSALSFSFGRLTTEEELVRAAAEIATQALDLRQLTRHCIPTLGA